MPLPLEGIRVIDWTTYQFGPVGTYLLADLGCEVIKLESRQGDTMRNLKALTGAPVSLFGEAEVNYFFPAMNRNKKSITLDLKTPEAKQIVRRLIAHSDVFVHNARGAAAERQGLGYETLRQYNAQIIYAQGSGFGPEGPDKHRAGYDPMGLARSGIMLTAGEPEMPPVTIQGGIADNLGGIFLAFGVQTALIARQKYGIGQKVDVSHFGSMITLMSAITSCGLVLGRSWERHSRTRARNPLWNYYQCRDGKWLQFNIIDVDRYWADFCKVLGIEGLRDDPRFSDWGHMRQHSEEVIRILDERFATKPRDEWMMALDAAGDFMYTFVNDIPDLRYDEQAVANRYVVNFNDKWLGQVKLPGFPFGLSETPASVRTSAPELGQHNDEVYSGICGFTSNEMAGFRARKVI